MISRIIGAIRHRATVRAVAHVMGIRALALAGNVCSGLLTAAFLGPEGRGELAALIAATMVIPPLCTIGLHASVIYNLRADPENASNYFGSAILLLIASSLTGMLLGVVSLPHWLGQYSSETILLARVLLFLVPFSVLSMMFCGVIEAHGRFGTSQSVLYVQSLVTLFLLGLLAAAGELTSHLAAWCYTILTLPTFFYLAFQAGRVLRPRFTMRSPFPQRLLRFGLRFYGVDILSVVANYLDQIIIVFLLPPASVGYYAVALSLSRVLTVLQGAVSTVLFPSIAARDLPSVVEMVGRAVRVTTVINVMVAVGIAVVGPTLLVVFYGARFQPAVAPFLILLLEAVVSSFARTLAQAFSGSGRPSAVTALELAGVVTSIVSMIILVPHFGIVGAAYGTLMGGGVRLCVALCSFRPVLGVRLPPLLINRMDINWVSGR